MGESKEKRRMVKKVRISEAIKNKDKIKSHLLDYLDKNNGISKGWVSYVAAQCGKKKCNGSNFVKSIRKELELVIFVLIIWKIYLITRFKVMFRT